jgi:hypothetical protein
MEEKDLRFIAQGGQKTTRPCGAGLRERIAG